MSFLNIVVQTPFEPLLVGGLWPSSVWSQETPSCIIKDLITAVITHRNASIENRRSWNLEVQSICEKMTYICTKKNHLHLCGLWKELFRICIFMFTTGLNTVVWYSNYSEINPIFLSVERLVYAYCSERPQFFSLRVCLIVGGLPSSDSSGLYVKMQTHRTWTAHGSRNSTCQISSPGVFTCSGLEDQLCTGTIRWILLLGSWPMAVRELEDSSYTLGFWQYGLANASSNARGLAKTPSIVLARKVHPGFSASSYGKTSAIFLADTI